MTDFFRDAAHISYEKVLEALEHLSATPEPPWNFRGKARKGGPSRPCAWETGKPPAMSFYRGPFTPGST